MLIFILSLLLTCIDVNLAKLFNLNAVKVLQNKQPSGNYFGFSLLLQGGDQPTILVGAPLNRNRNNNITGSIYRCNIYSGNCVEYNFRQFDGIPFERGNGELLGINLVGDDSYGGEFFTCAPRFTISYHINNYYMKGICFYVTNSTITWKEAYKIYPLKFYRDTNIYGVRLYYEAAFGESGFDIEYIKENNDLVIGAPGMVHWRGAVLKYNTKTHKYESSSLKYNTHSPDSYFGYSVAIGRFSANRSQLWYISGLPRGSDYRGRVEIFQLGLYVFDSPIILNGEEFGSYFGASILVVTNDQQSDDLLIGAPMYAGQTYDEGCVYYYRSENGLFLPPIKLYGDRKISSRFGSVMANLGKITLDSNNFVAISAPYEDGGIGVVYIYKRNQNGQISNNYHERITPIQFNFNYPIKGFGLGLSNTIDIDNNGHPDLAIGAYKTNHVFVLASYTVFKINIELKANVTIIYLTTRNFTLTYCVEAYPVNKQAAIEETYISQLLLGDERFMENQIVTDTLKTGRKQCWNHTISMTNTFINSDPIRIEASVHFVNLDNINKNETLEIPFSHGCGDDNVCRTDLSLDVLAPQHLVLGTKNELEIVAIVTNRGEAAFQVKLTLFLPFYMNLINLRECNSIDNVYICDLTDHLPATTKEKTFRIDISNIQPNIKLLTINLTITSIGVDVDSDNNRTIEIPVYTRNSPYLFTKSIPEGVTYLDNQRHLTHQFNFTQQFHVGNSGPSPFNTSLVLLIPNLLMKQQKIIRIQQAKGFFGRETVDCTIRNQTIQELNDTNMNTMNNSIILPISCWENSENCTEIYCYAGYLAKSSETIVFTVDFTVDLDLLLRKFSRKLNIKDIVSIITTAVITNETNTLQQNAVTFIYGLSVTSIPLWIYIASIIVGVVLLSILIFVLYKCNFFNRKYKQLLLNEEEFLHDSNHIEEEDEDEV